MDSLDRRVVSLLRSGDLAGAVTIIMDAVKESPSDCAVRWLAAETLAIQGELERADAHLDTIMSLDPKTAVMVVPLRHTLAADAARRDFFRSGRLPEFLDGSPTEAMRLRIEAHVHLRAGDRDRAAACIASANEARPIVAGRAGDDACPDFRDTDDIVAGVFEVLAPAGKYYWIPSERVEIVEFQPPTTNLDLLWRRARMVVRDGFDAEVLMPVVYGTEATADDQSRLARRTAWIGDPPGPVLGVGQRVFALDDSRDVSMLELTRLELAPA